MYGMINQGIKDLVTKKFGEDKWMSIAQEAQSPTDFVALQYYPDPLTYNLVGAASKVLGLPPTAILKEFGKYWVLYTAQEGYGPLMDLFGQDMKSCFKNLNNLHARMGSTMNQLNPPRFVYTELDEKTFMVEYHSQRQGLDPLVEGLIEGLGEKFKTPVEVEYSKDAARGCGLFKIKLVA